MDFQHKNLSVIFFFVSALIMHSNAAAQVYSVSGRVADAKTSETLVGANVYLPLVQSGVTTDSLGIYKLSVEEGKHRIIFSFIGYESLEMMLVVNGDMKVDVNLDNSNLPLREVVVSAIAGNRNIEQTRMSTISLNADAMRNIPAFMGEADLLKTVQLLPGVQSAGDGNTGFFVRGGNSDQNLVLFDGSVVYNPSHLFNFFSIFNPDAVEDLSLYKGGIPPMFGGRLSSVLDISMKEGNMEEYEVSGGIGLIASRISAEGPLQRGRSSFFVSGRRTYADMFLKLSKDENLRDTRLYFYDLNGKMNYVIDDRNRLHISGYYGRDITSFGNLFGLDWGNSTGSIRWNRILSERLTGNLSLLHSDYKFNISGDIGPATFRWSSSLNSIHLKTGFNYIVDDQITLSFGAGSIYHNLNPGNINAGIEGALVTEIDLSAGNAFEHSAYINTEQRFWENRVALEYGLRASMFQITGPGRQYNYDRSDYDNWKITDTVNISGGKLYDIYPGLEPRFGVRLLIDSRSSVKISYNRMIQYIQQAQSAQSVAPYDVWYMTSNNIPPQVANQIVAGYFRNLRSDTFETSLEVYYKDLNNISDVIDNGDILGNEFFEGQLRIGDGRTYGVEALIRKNSGRLTGFAGYTWARSMRRIEGINNGKPYNSPNDRRHDLSISGGFEVTPAVNLSMNFIYSTGRAFTLPLGKMAYQGAYAPIYGDRNSSRLPAYHRLDFAVTYNPGTNRNKQFESNWSFSVFNLYGRVNPISVSFAESPDAPGVPRSSFFYIPGPVPAVTWNFNF
jgi:hypothetical protein